MSKEILSADITMYAQDSPSVIPFEKYLLSMTLTSACAKSY